MPTVVPPVTSKVVPLTVPRSWAWSVVSSWSEGTDVTPPEAASYRATTESQPVPSVLISTSAVLVSRKWNAASGTPSWALQPMPAAS